MTVCWGWPECRCQNDLIMLLRSALGSGSSSSSFRLLFSCCETAKFNNYLPRSFPLHLNDTVTTWTFFVFTEVRSLKMKVQDQLLPIFLFSFMLSFYIKTLDSFSQDEETKILIKPPTSVFSKFYVQNNLLEEFSDSEITMIMGQAFMLIFYCVDFSLDDAVVVCCPLTV